MERIVKILFIILLFFFSVVQAQEVVNSTSLVTPQQVDYSMCNKIYDLPVEKLFYLSVASANANRFRIDEIQSKTGYILFAAGGNQYLASIIKIDDSHSQIKITPTNNNYFFAPGIVLNFLKYIDLNLNEQIIEIKKT